MNLAKSTKRSHVSIMCEAPSYEAREALIHHTSSIFVLRLEQKLREKHSKLQKQIETLKYWLDYFDLSDKERDLIKAGIGELESASVSVTFPDYLRRSYGSSPLLEETADCISETVFLAYLIEGQTRWRAIQLVTKEEDILYPAAPVITQQLQPPSHLIEIDKDSLSHFQNCRVPPKAGYSISSCTQDESSNLLREGCSTSNKPHISKLVFNQEGREWKRLENPSENALNPYGRLPSKYLEKSLSSSINSMISLENTRNLPRRPCRSYSTYIIVSNKAIMQKPFVNSFFYSFLSGSSETKNKQRALGDIN